MTYDKKRCLVKEDVAQLKRARCTGCSKAQSRLQVIKIVEREHSEVRFWLKRVEGYL